MRKPIVVIKFGSSVLTTKENSVDERIIIEIARQIASIQKEYRVVLVSSGAVAAGRKFMPDYHGTLYDRKAAAAIGNPILLQTYSQLFKPYAIPLAQSLCERHHFANRQQFLQLKKTYETLWDNGIIPIANENDVVSNRELQFSDNDELATLIAIGFGAQQLLLCTSVEGVLDEKNAVVREVGIGDKTVFSMVRKETSFAGLGGMTSKLHFAKLAANLGIGVTVFGTKEDEFLLKALQGEIGTHFIAEEKRLNARKKWLASGTLVAGALQLDQGAVQAVRRGNSLLAVGVEKVLRGFQAGEVFHLKTSKGQVFAIAKAKVAFDQQDVQKQNLEVANSDDIVIF